MSVEDDVAALRAENARLVATIRAMETSRSWRLTQPLRFAADRYRSHASARLLRTLRQKRDGHGERYHAVLPGPLDTSSAVSVCAIVHAFYLDLVPAILLRLLRCEDLSVVVVTFPADRDRSLYAEAFQPLADRGVAIELIAVENRGRDMLPFVTAIPTALSTSCQVFIKVHTKRSPHLGDRGGAWRDELLDGLLPDASTVASSVRSMMSDPNFGFGVPASRLAGRAHRGQNARAVRRLARRARLRVPMRLRFPAGGMYWCTRSWLETVESLGLTREDFEPEQGQLDGTMAHGLERLVGCYAHTKRATVWLPGLE